MDNVHGHNVQVPINLCKYVLCLMRKNLSTKFELNVILKYIYIFIYKFYVCKIKIVFTTHVALK